MNVYVDTITFSSLGYSATWEKTLASAGLVILFKIVNKLCCNKHRYMITHLRSIFFSNIDKKLILCRNITIKTPQGSKKLEWDSNGIGVM